MELKPGYKQTEVGVIPEDWDVMRLGECAAFRTGPFGSALHKSDYITDGVPLVNPMHIVNGVIKPSSEANVTEEVACSLSDFRLKTGEIVIGRRGDMGRCAVVRTAQDGWLCGTGSMIIRCKEGVSADYLQRILASPSTIAAIEATSVGSTMINLNQHTLSSLRIALPRLREQEATASALNDLDELQRSLESLITKKHGIKQAAMQELLTGKRRLPGFEGEWETKSIGSHIDLLTGYPFPSQEYCSSGIRLLRGSNVKRGQTDWSDELVQHWPSLTPEVAPYLLREGDLVIAMDGSLVGRSYARLTSSDLPALLLQRVARIRSVTLDIGFLEQFVGSKEFISHCDAVKTVTAIPHISPADIRSFKIAIPPDIREQTAISSLLSEMDAEIDILEQRLNKTRALKQAMMQELLTGRIRLV